MDPVESARELLPFLAVHGIAILYPLLAATATALSLAVAYRLSRPPRDPGVHWTERARHYWAGWLLLLTVALGCFVLFALGSALLHGPVSPVGPIELLAEVGIAVYLVARAFLGRRRRRYLGWLTARAARRSRWRYLLTLLTPLAAVALTGVLLPADPGPLFFAVLVPGLALFLFGTTGGGVLVARRLGLARPPPEGLADAVAAAARERGREPPRCLVADLDMANAFALPLLDTVLFSERAVAILDPAEARAVAAHEVAHLAEPGRVLVQRLLGTPFWLVLMGTRPLLAHAGPIVYLLSFALGLVLLVRTVRLGRRLETDADRHARGQAGAGEGDLVYARALEKLYRENLTPAVLRGALLTHPSLYDRLEAVGATPDYPRPAPPPRRTAVGIAAILPAVAVLLAALLSLTIGGRTPSTEGEAIRAIALRGGSPHLLAAMGRFRLQAGEPGAAATFYRAAEALDPGWPLHPAGLARALVRLGEEEAAREALRRAEERLAAFVPHHVEGEEEVAAAWGEFLDRFLDGDR